MAAEETRITVGAETLACSVDYAVSGQKPTVISLHGGGPSNRNTTRYLSEVFLKNDRSVVRFDFSGQGESSGLLSRSSLKKRHAETLGVIEHFGMGKNLTVVGTSMGGYIAASVVGTAKVENLILFCPAAYTTKAWDVEFGNGFTEIIREERSYLNTDAAELLEGFTGNALLFIGRKDEIIPNEVVDAYERSLSRCAYFKTVLLDDCPHPIHRWVENREEEKRSIKSHIEDMIRQTSRKRVVLR